MKKKLLIIPALISGLSIFALPANAAETRCGWLQNPTPANWWLTDRDGTWTISAQGDIKQEEWTIYPLLATGNMSEPMVIMDIPVLVYVFQQTQNK
jgi:hypothetical protein